MPGEVGDVGDLGEVGESSSNIDLGLSSNTDLGLLSLLDTSARASYNCFHIHSI